MELNTNTTFPALTGGVVTEHHVKVCKMTGHATHTVAGRDTGRCPRCGELKESTENPWIAAAEAAAQAHYATSALGGGKAYRNSRLAFKAAIGCAYPNLDNAGVYGLWVDCMDSVAYCADTFAKLDREGRQKYIAIGLD